MDQNSFDNSSMQPLEEDGGGRTLVWALLGIAALGCGLLFAFAFIFFKPNAQALVDQYFPSPTPTVTRTPTPTPRPTQTSTSTPTPTPNLTATEIAIQSTATGQAIETINADASGNWKVLLADDFDSDNKKWFTGNDDDEYASIQRTIDNSVYQWEATSKKGFVSWITVEIPAVTDFYAAVEAERAAGSSASDTGLIFREDSANNFYYFGVGDDGFFVSVNYDNEWIDIIEWGPSPAIRVGEVNRLAVIAQGSHFIFLLNDQVVGDAVDDHIASGSVGVGFQIYEPDQQVTVQFDNFELRKP